MLIYSVMFIQVHCIYGNSPSSVFPKMAAAGPSGQSFLRNLEERVMKESSIRKEALRKHVRVGCAFVFIVLSATQYT